MLRKKEDLIAKTIEQSKEDEKGRQKHDSCRCLTGIKAKFVPTSPWLLIDDNPKEVTVCILSKSDKMGPQIKNAISIQEDLSLNVYIDSRGGVEDTRLEAKAKDTKKIRGQGQGQPFREKTLSRPRTGMLEAKDQGHKRKCSPKKKKGLHKNFSSDLH